MTGGFDGPSVEGSHAARVRVERGHLPVGQAGWRADRPAERLPDDLYVWYRRSRREVRGDVVEPERFSEPLRAPGFVQCAAQLPDRGSAGPLVDAPRGADPGADRGRGPGAPAAGGGDVDRDRAVGQRPSLSVIGNWWGQQRTTLPAPTTPTLSSNLLKPSFCYNRSLMISEKSFAKELSEFIRFFASYAKLRLLGWGKRFEGIKDIIVAFLVVKRGKYSQSFLNISFFLLVGATLIAGPIIIENNPFISEYFQDQETTTQSVLATDISDMSVQTTISNKPRSEIREYTVRPGDTLASIADQFDITVDTIKWENNLKGNSIKPDQKLRILPVSGIAHKVRSGESVYSIAKRYDVDAQGIVNFPFNEFENLDTFALNVGDTLIVPGGVPPQEKPAPGRGPQRVTIVAGQAGSGQFIWPTTGNVSQYPVYYHMALDIANRSLPPVIASDTGTVSFAGCVGYGYGCHIIIDHGNGFQTLYGHLSRIGVSAGQGVNQGQEIGTLGSTGRSTGPHLHFEVRKGGVLQNPLGYLK